MNTMTSLLEKVEHAKDLDFGDVFNKSIELFKKVWVQGLVTMLLTMLLMLPLYLVMYLPLIAMDVLDPDSMQQEGGEYGAPNSFLFGNDCVYVFCNGYRIRIKSCTI